MYLELHEKYFFPHNLLPIRVFTRTWESSVELPITEHNFVVIDRHRTAVDQTRRAIRRRILDRATMTRIAHFSSSRVLVILDNFGDNFPKIPHRVNSHILQYRFDTARI